MKAFLTFLTAMVLGVSPAWAVLGQYASSVQSDQQQLHGELRTVSHDGFSVHEITSPDGTVIREYVAPSGLVFGVAWQGPTMPNLAELLGSYFQEFQQSAKSAPRKRGPVNLHTDHLVVEAGGHLRAFHGRAYLPSLLPHNVPETAVR